MVLKHLKNICIDLKHCIWGVSYWNFENLYGFESLANKIICTVLENYMVLKIADQHFSKIQKKNR